MTDRRHVDDREPRTDRELPLYRAGGIRNTTVQSGSDGAGPERLKREWTLDSAAFDKLLAALDSDRDAAGAKYEMLRHKLAKVFVWWGAAEPEDLVDETMNRVARKLAEGTEIRNTEVATFFRGVARMIFLESLRDRDRQHRIMQHAAENEPLPDDEEQQRQTEKRMQCLERCLEALTPENRQLIVEYYTQVDESSKAARKLLADRLGLKPTVLRLRAHRVREKLEQSVRDCVMG